MEEPFDVQILNYLFWTYRPVTLGTIHSRCLHRRCQGRSPGICHTFTYCTVFIVSFSEWLCWCECVRGRGSKNLSFLCSRNQKVLTSTHLCARLCSIMLCTLSVTRKVMDKFPQNSVRSSQFPSFIYLHSINLNKGTKETQRNKGRKGNYALSNSIKYNMHLFICTSDALSHLCVINKLSYFIHF